MNVATLQTLIATLTGVEVVLDPAVPRPFVSPATKGQIFLDIKATAQVGWDDFVRVFDEDLDHQVITQCGIRPFIASVRMESFDSTVNAYSVLEGLRSKLQRPSSLALLREDGLTINQFLTPTTPLPTTYDKRVVSVAILELSMTSFLGDGEGEVDDTDDGNWIETIDLEFVPVDDA